MPDTVIQVENLCKYYRLGVVGTGSLSRDLHRVWAKVRGKPDPALRVDQLAENQESGTLNGKLNNGFIWALKDISFEVEQGEVLGIIGRNGAGKSTLLKILSRVTTPTSGECRVKGRIASLLEVGTGFHPELTGRENIFLNGAILGMTKEEIRHKFDDIVAFAEVERFIDTPVKRYSSGMYVRLAFAVAAHLEPEILIVDEVLAVGDAAFQKKCLRKMGSVAHEGRTVLFVSHSMDAILALCTKAVLLDRGAFQCISETQIVIDRYKNGIFNKNGIYAQKRGFDVLKGRGSGEVCFTGISIMDSKKEKTGSIAQGETFFFDISFRVFMKISELQLYVAIQASKSGETISSVKHVISCDTLHEGTKGRAVVEVSNNIFRPKEYSLYFWLGDSSPKMSTDAFHIIDGDYAPQLTIIRSSRNIMDDNLYVNDGFFGIASRCDVLDIDYARP